MTSSDPADELFELRPDPPLRGLAIGAVAVLVGAVLLVASTEYAWPPAVSWLGLVLGVVGVGISIAAWVATRRLRSEVTVRRAGITVAGVRGRTTLPWSEIERVAAVAEQVVLVRAEDRPEVIIVNPRGAREPNFIPLVEAIRDRMDADRGYHSL